MPKTPRASPNVPTCRGRRRWQSSAGMRSRMRASASTTSTRSTCTPASRHRFGWNATLWACAIDDPRGLTITGGLPYAGGPASGYMTHAIASAFDRLRHTPGRALVTGVGMHMAKHVAAVWSSTPNTAASLPLPDRDALQSEVDADQPRRPLLTTWSGPATVCAYTVAHGRDGAAERGLVVLDTEEGRALARVHEPDLLADAESRELVGQAVSVTTDGKSNEARW